MSVAFILHIVFWLLGVDLICAFRRRSQNTSQDDTAEVTLKLVDHIAAYFLGLLCFTVVAFTLNQFANVTLTETTLENLCLGVVFLSLVASRLAGGPFKTLKLRREASLWSHRDLALLAVIAVVFADRHALVGPLTDWDSFLYHLPFGKLVAEGNFPSDIGRSYILQMEAAYPPLFYFLYGVNALIESPNVTYMAPRGLVAVLNALILCVTYALARERFGLDIRAACWSALITLLILPTEPYLQSITTLYLLLAIYYSWNAFEKDTDNAVAERRGNFLIGTFFWAGAYWCTYLSLPLIAFFFGGLLLFEISQRGRQQASAINIGRFSISVLIVASFIAVHWIRNWLIIGNPLYPALLDVVGGHDISEWFLANRPDSVSPIEKTWRFIPNSLAVSGPMIHLILAAASLTLLRSSLSALIRTVIFCLLFGFTVIWFEMLHLQHTPIERYLYPLVPIAAVTAMTVFSERLKSSNRSALTAAVVIAGMEALLVFHWFQFPHAASWAVNELPQGSIFFTFSLATIFAGPPLAERLWCPQSDASQETLENTGKRVGCHLLRIGGILFLAIIVFHFVPTLRLSLFSIAFILFTLFIAEKASKANTESKPPSVWVRRAILLAGLLIFGIKSDWSQANEFSLPTQADLTWMNQNLADSDTVMVSDGRLFTLDRKFIGLDHARLEDFAIEPDPRKSLEELKATGVTHLYVSYAASAGLADWFFDKKFLVPSDDNPIVKIVHQSQTGWVAKINYGANSE
ncbi:MAG: hypothetical protein CMJ78_20710 [Planctomycetaceae bacterium]|nr:hypothetical protein [Planctomycetaceae bacterium]